MKIRVQSGLPFAEVRVRNRGRQITLANMLLDTGSAGTILAVDRVSGISLELEPDDAVHRIRGVGGSEFVFAKRLDSVALDDLSVADFEAEVGAMDYGFEIDGILGLDFLSQVGALIDLSRLEVYGPGLT